MAPTISGDKNITSYAILNIMNTTPNLTLTSVPHATVSVRSLRPLVQLLDQSGAKVEEMLSEFSLTRDILKEGNFRMSHSEAVAFWNKSQEILGDPLIGVRSASQIEKDVFDVLSYAFRTSENLLEAYERSFRHFKIFHSSSETGMDVEESVVKLYHSFPLDLEKPFYFSDFILSAWLIGGKTVNHIDLRPIKVILPYARPAHSSELEAFFGCPIEFAGKRAEIHFQKSDLEVLLPERDQLLSKVIEQHLEKLISEFQRMIPGQ